MYATYSVISARHIQSATRSNYQILMDSAYESAHDVYKAIAYTVQLLNTVRSIVMVFIDAYVNACESVPAPAAAPAAATTSDDDFEYTPEEVQAFAVRYAADVPAPSPTRVPATAIVPTDVVPSSFASESIRGLKAIARTNGLSGYSRLTKAELQRQLTAQLA